MDRALPPSDWAFQVPHAETSVRSTRRSWSTATIVAMTRATRHRTSLADLAALIVALAVSVGVLLFDQDTLADRRLAGIAIALVAATLLAVGGRFPRIVIVSIGALDVITLALTSSPVALRPLLAVGLYRLVRQQDERLVILFAGIIAVTVAGVGALVGDEPFWLEWSTDAAVLLLPIAAADARRTNARRRADAIEREVAERLHVERLRIAHDLHDIVAHSLSAITVQSGIAAHIFERDPVAARRALAEINDAGRRSLDELRSLLGLLRSDESVPIRPVPAAPHDLHDVVANATGGDLTVEITEQGTYPDDVAESTVVTVHRIVHECLVNVVRHAGQVPTTVDLVHDDDGVHVVVSNDAPPSTRVAAPSTGIGLVAMRERAEMLGDRVDAAATEDGGFVVRGFVPYHSTGAGRP
jgi:signal transduction histidine kinase